MVSERGDIARLRGRTIAILHFGGLGDVVLLAESVARFRAAEPDARIIVFCRAEFVSATRCYAAPADTVLAIALDPYGKRPDLDAARVAFTLDEPVDLAVCAELRPTWLSFVAIERLRPVEVRIAEASPPEWLAPSLETDPTVRVEHIAARDGTLFAAVAPDGAASRPLLRVDGSSLEAARATLQDDVSAPFVAVFPFCEARVPYKAWPIEHFERLTAHLTEAMDKNVLLVGDRSEGPRLEALRARATSPDRIRVFAGAPDELPRCFAALASAEAFVGNDTGLSHAAAALGVPGVTLFGGGFWPAYGPWARGSVGIVAPMPCFGCGWDCAFGRGFCVETIPFEMVVRQFAELSREAEPRVVTCDAFSPLERDLIEAAATRHRSLAATHRHEVGERERRIGILEAAASDRLDALIASSERNEEVEFALEIERVAEVESDRELASLRDQVRSLEAVAAERLAALEHTASEASRATAAFEASQAASEAARAALETRFAETATAAAERLAELERVSRVAQMVQAEADKRSVIIADLSSLIESQHLRIEALQRLAAGEPETQRPRS